MTNFLNEISDLPPWGQGIDKKIQIYTDGLAQWVRGNDDWTFESGRYFGEEGLKIQMSRATNLVPLSTGFVKKKCGYG
ncbi:hypothetical protein E2P81_ATG04342 [Venturia nashicola]|uniref:Uncharacterized protein n=1 Tax=Venturia nashicola TaxID=86259 RepID=A0A4Z1PNE1_9PEZI|nr:hypothetical protein E6O75_ATG04445 [Venturia nashicola]TLD37530.1 hypothetical protein E2P81_ATG04342 [Venturia nashicola]